MEQHSNGYKRYLMTRRRLSRRTVVRVGASVAASSAAAAFLAGCGGGTNNNANNAGPRAPSVTQAAASATSVALGAASPAAAAATTKAASPAAMTAATGAAAALGVGGTPKVGGTLPLYHGAETITLDPHTQASYASQYPVILATNGIFWQMPGDPNDPTDWKITGDLASSSEQPDNLTWVLKLNQGVTFQNLAPVNGRELTADDIKYNLQRMATDDPKFQMRSKFNVIDKIDTPDKYTIRFTTKVPYAPMAYNLAYPWANMLAHEVVEAGQVETKLVGTGPWMLTKFEKDTGLSYDRNPTYWKKDPWIGVKLPNTDKVELIAMYDQSTQIAAMRAGKIAYYGGGPDIVKDLKNSNPNLVAGQKLPSIAIACLQFNLNQKPFDDQRVRQAFMWATTREDYWLSANLEGQPSGPMSPGTKLWRLDDSDLPKIPDLTKAKQLLAAAGYANGLEVTTTSTQPYYSPNYSEVAKAQLAKIGVKVNIQQLDNATWLSKVYKGQDYQMSAFHDYAFDDPDAGLYDYYYSKGGANDTNIKDQQLDTLLEQQRAELDSNKRRDLVMQIQKRLLDLVPKVFIYAIVSQTLYQPWFKGYREEVVSAVGNYRNYQFSWVEKT